MAMQEKWADVTEASGASAPAVASAPEGSSRALGGFADKSAKPPGNHEPLARSHPNEAKLSPEAQSLLARLRASVWFPVLAKSVGVIGVLLVLAVIGSWSSLERSFPGVHRIISSEPELARQLGVDWVPSVPAAESASAEHSHSGASRGAEPGAAELAVLSVVSASALAEAGAEPAGEPCDAAEAGPQRPPGVTPDGLIILNTASVEEFTRLPGIGKRRAENIVALRERLKGFKRKTDLLRIRGIGPRSMKQLSPLIVVDPPPPPKPEEAPSGGDAATNSRGAEPDEAGPQAPNLAERRGKLGAIAL